MKYFFYSIFLLLSYIVHSQSFPIYTSGDRARILYDSKDAKVVSIASELLAEDIERVVSSQPEIHTKIPKGTAPLIVIGTLGQSRWIDVLEKEGKINVSNIRGKWETFAHLSVDNPFGNNQKALIIVGSDRRGTAYGVFELSKAIGVSPWYWWADVPVKKKKELTYDVSNATVGPPSVQYRGIFINDEDWGLKPWAAKTFESELGDIGPKTYAKVFELMLRLKANYLWPAMHECTGAFNAYADNKKVADDYGIVMGSSHCEPVLFNNATEWDEKTMGEWDYHANREGVYKILNQRVKENSPYENVYTLGMRGIHDHEMKGNLPLEQQIEVVEEAIADQRKMIAEHTQKSVEEVPQIFVPYAEVLHLYDNGLEIPEDVTLMWVDDNYGYVRRLSDPLERKRKGGAGVYYHVSYLGNPVTNLWLNSANPMLMWSELRKSYDYGAQKVWVVNVGDIKPAEYGAQFFLDLAWDIDCVDANTVFDHQDQFYKTVFPDTDGVSDLMKQFYTLNFSRKPEFMGWNEQCARNGWIGEHDGEFSFTAYREAERRLNSYANIAKQAKRLYQDISDDKKASFYQLIYYPVVGANYMNRKYLLSQKNRWYARQKRAATNRLYKESLAYVDSLNLLTQEYNDQLDGKWKHIMWVKRLWGDTAKQDLPRFEKIELQKKSEMGIAVEGMETVKGSFLPLHLPTFSGLYKDTYRFTIYNKGEQKFTTTLKPSEPWIRVSQAKIKIEEETDIEVMIDWNALTDQEETTGFIEIEGAGTKEMVYVTVHNPDVDLKEVKGLFVEKNGVVSIQAENYHRAIESGGVTWQKMEGLGRNGGSVLTLPFIAPRNKQTEAKKTDPHLEYDFYAFNSGLVEITTHVLPTHPVNNFNEAMFGLSIDNEAPIVPNIEVGALNTGQWKDNVRRNAAVVKTLHYVDQPGKHTLRLWRIDPGMVYDKIILDFGGLQKSYLGPEETRIPDVQDKIVQE